MILKVNEDFDLEFSWDYLNEDYTKARIHCEILWTDQGFNKHYNEKDLRDAVQDCDLVDFEYALLDLLYNEEETEKDLQLDYVTVNFNTNQVIFNYDVV